MYIIQRGAIVIRKLITVLVLALFLVPAVAAEVYQVIGADVSVDGFNVITGAQATSVPGAIPMPTGGPPVFRENAELYNEGVELENKGSSMTTDDKKRLCVIAGILTKEPNAQLWSPEMQFSHIRKRVEAWKRFCDKPKIVVVENGGGNGDEDTGPAPEDETVDVDPGFWTVQEYDSAGNPVGNPITVPKNPLSDGPSTDAPTGRTAPGSPRTGATDWGGVSVGDDDNVNEGDTVFDPSTYRAYIVIRDPSTGVLYYVSAEDVDPETGIPYGLPGAPLGPLVDDLTPIDTISGGEGSDAISGGFVTTDQLIGFANYILTQDAQLHAQTIDGIGAMIAVLADAFGEHSTRSNIHDAGTRAVKNTPLYSEGTAQTYDFDPAYEYYRSQDLGRRPMDPNSNRFQAKSGFIGAGPTT